MTEINGEEAERLKIVARQIPLDRDYFHGAWGDPSLEVDLGRLWERLRAAKDDPKQSAAIVAEIFELARQAGRDSVECRDY